MYIFYICIYLGKSNHKCRPKNLLLYKFLIVQKGVSHLNITIYFRNLHIYNIFQEPAHIQYISGTCTYTIYFRNLHIYNIFQEPAHIQYISGTCKYTIYFRNLHIYSKQSFLGHLSTSPWLHHTCSSSWN